MNLELELSIFDNQKYPEESENQDACWKLAGKLVAGEYESLLLSEVGKKCLQSGTNRDTLLESYIEESVEGFLKEYAQDDSQFGEVAVLCTAVSCLQLFTQNNWSGPPTSLNPLQMLGFPEEQWEKINSAVISALSVDGESAYSLAEYPAYLLIAKTILLNCRQKLGNCQTSDLWLMRCLQIQQSLVTERSPTLKATILELIADIKTKEPLMADNKYRNIQIQFYVEAGHLLYFYYDPKESKEYFDKATKISGLSIELTGVMGKRTKYQEKSLAQLVLQVVRSPDRPTAAPLENTEKLPKNAELTDDTILQDMQLEDENKHIYTQVTPTEQALILALCHQHKKNSESQGDILREECMAFISKVLSQPQNWCVQSMALFLRTYWESDSGRRLERTMNQLEELVNQMRTPADRPSHRTHLLYCSRWQPKWFVQKELGELMLKVGSVKSALDIFLPLELWDDIIKCYIHIGRTEAAEKVVRAQLEKKETPAMWCHLGDVLGDPECYEKAWEVSDHHYSGAQRSLALYYLRKGQFAESLPCFEKTLEINPLQIGTWFSYGCASMAVKNWENAAKGFRRCVTIETQNFEAWSNLATAYIRSNQKSRAFSALQEALKCEYENWRLWENYLPLAVDVGEFDEAIRAYHRLIELKNKYDDAEVLGILVKAVTENMHDASEKPASRLRGRLLELMGRVTSTVTTDAQVWRHYATLLINNPEVSDTDRQRALQYLQKCHRCLTQSANWEKDVQKSRSVANEATDIAKTFLCVTKQEDNKAQASQMLSSARLMLKGTLTKIKKTHTDPATGVLLEELVEPCAELEEQLNLIVDLASQLRDAS